MGLGLSNDVVVHPPSGPVFHVRGHRYRTLDRIGKGSEAIVYRCEDKHAALYAVKVFYFSRFPPSELSTRVKSFTREARILKYMGRRSRHFIGLVDYEYKPKQNIGYMVMELGDGSLRQRLLEAPMSSTTRRMYWKQIVTILRELQDARVVHADIKPDNIILVNNVLKLTDLGLAFRMDSSRDTIIRRKVRGTIDYMAPETFFRRTGFKSDVWSAGIILYEMVYGTAPYFNIADRNKKVAAISSKIPIPFAPLKNRRLLDCMKRCLQFNERYRPSAPQLQAHPYTRTK